MNTLIVYCLVVQKWQEEMEDRRSQCGEEKEASSLTARMKDSRRRECTDKPEQAGAESGGTAARR